MKYSPMVECRFNASRVSGRVEEVFFSWQKALKVLLLGSAMAGYGFCLVLNLVWYVLAEV